MLRRAARLFLYLTFFELLLWPFVQHAWQSEVFVDEVTFLSAGNGAVAMIRRGEFLSPKWTGNDWGQYGWVNPWLAKYLMGLSMHLTGHGDEVFKTWYDQGAPITHSVLLSARAPGVLLGWGTCVLLFFLGRRISPAVGIFAAAYVGFNEWFEWTTSLAMLDGPCAFFSVLTALLLFQLKDLLFAGAAWARLARRAAAVGVAAGCAISAKYNGGLALAFAMILLGGLGATQFAGVARLPRGPLPAFVCAAIVGLATALTVYGLNPHFYRHPIDQLRATAQFWSTRYGVESTEIRVTSRLDAARRTTRILVNNDTSKLFNRETYYRLFNLDHRVKNYYESRYVAAPWSLALIGYLWATARIAIERYCRGRAAALTDPEANLLWSLVTCFLFILWLPADFDRYFLPPFLTTPVLIGYGARDIALTSVAAWRRLRPAALARAS